MARCHARNRHAYDWRGRQVGLCQRWVAERGQRCYLHGARSTGPKNPPAIGYSAARRKCAQADIERCRRLGIKRPSGRRRGGAWVTVAMLERAALIARGLGFWRLPRPPDARDWRRLVWTLLRGDREKAAELLRAAEIAEARGMIEERRRAISSAAR